MMKEKQIAILIVIALISICSAKRGGGGFGGFSRGGGGSKSGGWSFSRPSPSRPSPSYSAPSYKPSPSYNAPSYGWNSKPSAPSPSPSYGWSPSISSPSNRPSSSAPSYGWSPSVSSGSTHNQPKPAAPSYGWNVPGTNANAAPKPVGPPPSYPGLSNQHVPSNNKPPAYSPSYSNPPAYSPSYNHPSAYSPSNSYKPSSSWTHNSPSYARPSYSTGSGYYGNNNYNSFQSNSGYGSTFGNNGLGGNTYISNNYYGSSRSGGGSGFLSNALFYGAGMHSGYMWGNRNSYRDHRRWDEEEDRRWRASTKAPYFENKVPGSEVILPASAVVGAATAFGLASLLPLNVPANKPLMYCSNSTSDIAQTQILINGKVYQCLNETILLADINCPKSLASNNTTTDIPIVSINENTTEPQVSTESSLSNTQVICNDEPKIMQCDSAENIFCTNGTLLSRIDIFCNSTTLMNGTTNLNDSTMALTCYEGLLAAKQTAFIPTTTTTEAPLTTTQKSLSFAAKTHLFFLRLIGKGDSIKKPETTTPIPDEIPQQSIDESLPIWVPEALTIPPETTTEPPTTPKMIWAMKSVGLHDNGTVSTVLKPVGGSMESMLDSTYALDPNSSLFSSGMYTKIISTTENPKNVTEASFNNDTETPIQSSSVTSV